MPKASLGGCIWTIDILIKNNIYIIFNQLFEFYDSLVNLDHNGRIIEKVASATNEVGEIS
jgi:hypothetical protein